MEISLALIFILPIAIILVIFFANKVITNPSISILLLASASYAGYIGRIAISNSVEISLFQIFLLISLLVTLVFKLVNRDNTILITGFELEWLLLFSLIFLSLIYSPNRVDGLFYSIRFLVLIMMLYLIINNVNKEKYVIYILVSISIISVFLGIFSIVDGFKPENLVRNISSFGGKVEGRSSINIEDPNIFASHFMIPIFFLSTVVIFPNISKWLKTAAIIILPILLLGVAATFSRSVWVSLFAGLILLAFMRKQYKIFVWALLLFSMAIIIVPDLRLIIENLYQRALDIFAGVKDDSSRTRLLLLSAGISMGFDSLLFGVGIRGYPVLASRYFTSQETIGVIEPHNLFYTLFAELGIIGLVLYSWILFRIGHIAYNNYKKSSTSFSGIINLTLFLSFLCYIFFYQFYGGGMTDNNFWIIVGLILSLNNIYIKQQFFKNEISSGSEIVK